MSLTKRFNTDPADPRVGFVRLTGLAHADERAAFKEMARQLCGQACCLQSNKHVSLPLQACESKSGPQIQAAYPEHFLTYKPK